MQAESLDACSAEIEVFGAEHGDLGGFLLGLWGLPVPVVDAIALHHKPQKSTLREFSPLTAVHISNAAQAKATATSPVFDRDYLHEIGLNRSLDEWRNLIRTEAP
jgi:HD-like signal output (HDOD) protein